jgi:arsenate reductase (thioredoxin)
VNVYFVCVGNAGRSQMAEAFAKQAGHDARSAGSRPARELDQEVVEVMAELGIDLADRMPKGISQEDVEWADVVVTMGCGEDACPVLPAKRYVDWQIRDPIGLPITDVRVIRDDVRARVEGLLEAP